MDDVNYDTPITKVHIFYQEHDRLYLNKLINCKMYHNVGGYLSSYSKRPKVLFKNRGQQSKFSIF